MIKKDINELRNEICNLAISKCDCKYIHGSHGPNTFDCSGLVWYTYNKILDIDLYECGFGLSTTTKIMTSRIGKFFYKQDLKLVKNGDILFFHRQALTDTIPLIDNKFPGHVGIYLGNNTFIHSTGMYKKVVISKIDSYWSSILIGSKDIISDEKILKRKII